MSGSIVDQVRELIMRAEREGLEPSGILLGPVEELCFRGELRRFSLPQADPEELSEFGHVTSFLGLPVRLVWPTCGVALEFEVDQATRLLGGETP